MVLGKGSRVAGLERVAEALLAPGPESAETTTEHSTTEPSGTASA